MADERRIQRIATTPGARGSGAWTSLPGEILEQSCRRVGIAAGVFASLWAATLILGHTVFAGLSMWPLAGTVISGTGIAISLLLLGLARKLEDRPKLLLNIGLGYQVVTALLIALLEFWDPAVVGLELKVSWIAVVILVYPTLAPNTPAKIFGASLLAASMAPVGYLVTVARGVPLELSAPQAVATFLPNYIAALLAVIPAEIIQGLTRQVRKARELGSYRLGEVLGVGGMGEVHLAEHRMLARPAAIKLIRPEVLGGVRGQDARIVIERFKREAQAAARLRSPHTIELYDFGTTEDGNFYYAMELLDGLSLEQLVERFGPVPPERAVHFLRQAADSLAEAHARGLIHRDVTPSNLYATRLGLTVDFIKVLDFGLVKATRPDADDTTLTAPHVTTGTPAYMAPESALGEKLTGKTDVYGLGCVAFWLLTGRLLFDGDTPMKVMMKHVKEPPLRAAEYSEFDVPPDLDNLVLACLAKDPAERPPADALINRLSELSLPAPWTPDRAWNWWETHMPGELECGPCTKGVLAPALSTE